jgi:hypothetical protein
VVLQVDHLDDSTAHALQPLRDQIDTDHLVAAVLRDPAAHVTDRAEPEHDSRPAVGHRRVLDCLPGRRQHIREEDEPVVREAVRHLDRQGVAERDAHVLGLPAWHLPIQLGVAEQGRARSVLANLRRLALGLQAPGAHEAAAAGDVERHHDAITDLYFRHA